MSGPFDTAVTPEPRPVAARRVSLVRVGFVLLVVAALIAGGVRWTMAVISDVQAEQPLTAFAPSRMTIARVTRSRRECARAPAAR